MARAEPLLRPGERVVLASHNRGKLVELAEMLAPLALDLVSAPDLGLPDPEETASDFAGNALLKARAAAAESGLAAIGDDSGLAVDALGGLPGIWSARWAEAEGPGGGVRDFRRAMERVHRELVASGAPEPWRARFVCAIALVRPDGREQVFLGEVPGRITWPPRGDRGFGYDPIFIPDGEAETFGEMDPARKNAMSHRARALAKMREALLG